MGKLTQMISYLNAEKHPTAKDIQHYYTHFSVNEDDKKIRRQYRSKLNLPIENDIMKSESM